MDLDVSNWRSKSGRLDWMRWLMFSCQACHFSTVIEHYVLHTLVRRMSPSSSSNHDITNEESRVSYVVSSSLDNILATTSRGSFFLGRWAGTGKAISARVRQREISACLLHRYKLTMLGQLLFTLSLLMVLHGQNDTPYIRYTYTIIEQRLIPTMSVRQYSDFSR
jgi:hypothetical protein